MRTPFIVALVLLASASAGCIDDETPPDPAEAWTAHLVIDYGGQHPDSAPDMAATVPFDPTRRPALSEDEATGTERPDAFTVHDLMVLWSQDSGVPIDAGHHPEFGFSLEAVDGLEAWFGDNEGWFWHLAIDGESSPAGMGLAVVQDGAQVAWTYTYTSW